MEIPKDDRDTLKWALREVSALGGMLMHLQPGVTAANEFGLVNRRRNRARYGTYPTSPRVAQAAARYVWTKLALNLGQKSGPLYVCDPTMEGGPLLLETAFLASLNAAQKTCRRHEHAYDFMLSGVDQNPVSGNLVSTLLETWRSRTKADNLAFDLTCNDAIDWLRESKGLDAILNNPPWGARTDGATSKRLSPHGPYIGYRDPYIALVSLGLARLKPGRPFAFVLPFQLLTAASASRLRHEILENSQLDYVIQLPRKAFPRTTVKTVMVLGS